jgi:hypothetical protein
MSTETIESTYVVNKGKVEFYLSLNEAKQIASVGVFAGRERDTYTPALSVISVQIALGGLTAVATDRYCVGKLDLQGLPEDLIAGFYLSPEAAKFITGIKQPRSYGGVSLSVIIENNQLTLSALGTTYTEVMFSGKFPAVQTLFDDLVAGPIQELGLKPDFIGKLSKLVGSDGKKLDGSWRFTFHTGPAEHRANPVLATNSAYSVLIQPAMLGK